MRLIFGLLFCFTAIAANAQLVETFDDGDFLNGPTWTGDAGNFIVNAGQQLQLNAAASGQSYLAVPVSMPAGEAEWKFMIDLDFSPSTSNYCMVYLLSDQADLTGPLHGYYLQFGEAQSNDAIELFRQDSLTVTSVCRGPDAQVAAPFHLYVRVTRSVSGEWKIFSSPQAGSGYTEIASGTDATPLTPGWFGFRCVYTSGNVQGFVFDDIYAGMLIPDTVAPAVIQYETTSPSMLTICFDEYPLDAGAVSLVLSPAVTVSSVSIDTGDASCLNFLLSSSFSSGVQYEFTLTGVRDVAGNVMNPFHGTFTWYPEVFALKSDVIFTEVYFQTSSVSPLPEAEYAEIFNRLDAAVRISGWTLSDAGSDASVQETVIPPKSYAILCDASDVSLFSTYGRVVPVQSFPSLNNSGDELMLKDAGGNVIDKIQFDGDSYKDESKDGGGWSIERIDTGFTCEDPGNWRASVAPLQGTPGIANSVTGKYADDMRPYILKAFPSDSTTVAVYFSETDLSGTENYLNYRIKKSAQNISISGAVNFNGGVLLSLDVPLTDGIYTVSAGGISDCPGNETNPLHEVPFGLPADTYDGLIINEILYDPYEGGEDFIEIFNSGNLIVNLARCFVHEGSYEDPAVYTSSFRFDSLPELMMPGAFLVLTGSPDVLEKQYICPDPYAFRKVSLPDFNSSDGSVILTTASGKVIETIRYSDDQHFDLLDETKGISLERVSPDANSMWHSASSACGYATPGYRNSQAMNVESSDEIGLTTEIFSPDNDGYNDLHGITYELEEPGTMLSILIFDDAGRKVRTLVKNENAGTSGIYVWDGLKDDGRLAGTGLYIILARLFSIQGGERQVKKTCAIARRT